jgi:hypothetical protein
MPDTSYHQPSAAQRALQLPEILQAVIDAVDPSDRRTLHAAIRVNRAWADAGTSVLWRQPPAKAILLVDAARQPLYAAKIRALSFLQDYRHHNLVQHLAFPRLTSLSLGEGVRTVAAGSSMAHYFRASVRQFRLLGGVLTPQLVQLLTSQCPRLKQLQLSLKPAAHDVTAASRGAGMELLPDMLRQCRALTVLSLNTSPNDDHLMAPLLAHLAARAKLTSLEIAVLVKHSSIVAARDALPMLPGVGNGAGAAADGTDDAGGHADDEGADIAADSGRWFPDLRHLDVVLESKSVPIFLAMMNSQATAASSRPPLATLKLRLTDAAATPPTALSAIARYAPALRSLQVSWSAMAAVTLPAAELLALRALRQLRELVVRAGGAYGTSNELALDDLTDDDFSALAASVPLLRILRIRGRGPLLSGRALRALGGHCRALEHLELGGTWDLSCLHEEVSGGDSAGEAGPSFPMLKSLLLDNVLVTQLSAEAQTG